MKLCFLYPLSSSLTGRTLYPLCTNFVLRSSQYSLSSKSSFSFFVLVATLESTLMSPSIWSKSRWLTVLYILYNGSIDLPKIPVDLFVLPGTAYVEQAALYNVILSASSIPVILAFRKVYLGPRSSNLLRAFSADSAKRRIGAAQACYLSGTRSERHQKILGLSWTK